MMSEFEPKIVAFVCRWCTYAGADLAGTCRLKYEPNVKIIRLPCTGRIDYMFLLKAFAEGADGVIVSGCHPNDCHYIAGNFHARRRWIYFRKMADFMGLDINRMFFSWVSAAEGKRWAEVVDEFTDKVRKMGSFSAYGDLAKKEAVNHD